MKRSLLCKQAAAAVVFLVLTTPALLPGAEEPPFAARRAKLMEIAGEGIILVPSQIKAGSSFRDSTHFYYLTGLAEAEAVLFLNPGNEPSQVLFRRRAGRPEMGRPSEAPEDPGFAVDELDRLAQTMRRAAAGNPKICLPFSGLEFIGQSSGNSNPLVRADSLVNLESTLSAMRMVKDPAEIEYLRRAVSITAEALREAYRAAEPGIREIDLAAILKYTFARRDTEESFLQAASGPNSTNVHFGATSRSLQSGDMIVFDVGAYFERYTGDISRTIPASGKFTKEQKEIYDLVLEAQKEGCRRLVAGVTFKAVQDEVERILIKGLARLGLVTDPESPWQRRLYIQHGFGHFIGLDIHDVWSYHSPRLDEIRMAPGMVVTMEPGLYFPEMRFERTLASLKGKAGEDEIRAFAEKVGPVYEKYINIGVRIEDDILITEAGNEILSAGVPKDVNEIVKLMREKSPHNVLK